MNSILRAEKLTRILPSEVPVTLVQDIDLAIGQSEFVAIMGPSGSGKSSLLYLLGLLDSPTSGKLWLEDEETSRFSDSQLAQIRLQRIGFVFQFHFLLAEFSSLENVMLPMRKLGRRSAAHGHHAKRDCTPGGGKDYSFHAHSAALCPGCGSPRRGAYRTPGRTRLTVSPQLGPRTEKRVSLPACWGSCSGLH